MTVLHINGYDHGGGSETVFNISRNNENNEVNISGFIDQPGGSNADIKFSTYKNYSKLLRIFVYFFSFNNYLRLKKYLTHNSVDVIHLHNFIGALSPAILLAIKNTKRKKKYVVVQTAHDFNICCPNSLLYNYSKNIICEKCLGKKVKIFPLIVGCDRRGKIFSFLKGIRSIYSNNILNHKEIIDKFIAPSELMKEKIIEDGINNNKISVIRNPLPNIFSYDGNKENIICYFGRFSKEKDVPFIINTFTYWKQRNDNDFKLFLIGGGEEEDIIRDIVKKNPYSSEIWISEFLPERELINSIKFCKYFIMASQLYENAPMTILEAVSLNIIPIVPSLGGMKETIEKVIMVGKTYKSKDYDSLIKCIEELEQNYSEELRKMSGIKKEISEKLGVVNYYSKLNNLYNELIINNSKT